VTNEGESAASFCCQVAALFPDIFCNFYLVKNRKIAKNSTTTKARKNKKSLLLRFFDVCLTKFKKNQNLLNKINQRFLLKTKLIYWTKEPHFLLLFY